MLTDQKHKALGDYCIWYVGFGYKSGCVVVCEKGSPKNAIIKTALRKLGFLNVKEYYSNYPNDVKKFGFSTQKDYYKTLPHNKYWGRHQPYQFESLDVWPLLTLYSIMLHPKHTMLFTTIEEVTKCGYDITTNEMWFCEDWNMSYVT